MPVLDRDVLIYPRIHVRDVNWLKATLLSFPAGPRMEPEFFDLKDSEEIQSSARPWAHDLVADGSAARLCAESAWR